MPESLVHIGQRFPGNQTACHMHQTVNVSELVGRTGNRNLCIGRLGEIGLDGQCLATELLDLETADTAPSAAPL